MAYYDWGQRPCPSPPLPEPVGDCTRYGFHEEAIDFIPCGAILATVGMKQIFSYVPSIAHSARFCEES